MTTLRMRLRAPDRSYDIVIGLPLKSAFRELLRDADELRPIVITDSNVGALYGPLVRTFGRSGSPIDLLEVPAGEASKSRAMKERLENRLVGLNADRRTLIVALGGGMIGDLAGFVAATYMRGVPYIQLPTSLLAQVDSSVGGKVAVNHPGGKNMIGAFYQPQKVYIDPATLATLSEKEFRNGLAEVLKYAVIMDVRLFEYLGRNRETILRRKPEPLGRIIAWCCRLKRSVVERDEQEAGPRRILNFGHTIGHAVEALSGYRISHGMAVAIGMASEARLAVRLGILGEAEASRIESLARAFGLPTTIPSSLPPADLLRETRHDKKSREGIVQFTLPSSIGRPAVGIPVAPAALKGLLNA